MTEEIVLSEAEQKALEVLTAYLPEPGTRCPTCHHRFNKPRQTTSPEALKVDAGRLPTDRATNANQNLDWLVEYVGADSTSYARGDVYEKMLVFAIQQREALKAFYEGTE